MEAILWFALGVLVLMVINAFCASVAFAWRLHRRSADDLAERRKDANRGMRLTDHRYDPKQFRRR